MIKTIRGKGRCVFADASFLKGEIVIRESIIFLPKGQEKYLLKTVMHQYYFGDKFEFVPLGHCLLLSHSHAPNLNWFASKNKKEVKFIALRNIKKGEELTFDYGWDEYPWENSDEYSREKK